MMMNAQLKTRDDQFEADYDWLADYMAGRLTDAGDKEFEQRLLDDPEFFRMMAPFLTVMLPIEPSPIEIEVRERVAARRAAQQRAKQEREARRRRLNGWIAAIATAAFPVKVIAGFATATLIYAVVRLERPSDMTPAPIFVQVLPTVPDTRSTGHDAMKSLTHPRPTVVATNSSDFEMVPIFTVTVDSTAERALAEILAKAPLAEPQFTPAARAGAQRARNVRQVAVIQVDTVGGNGLKQFMDGVGHGIKGALGAVAGKLADLARRRRPVHQVGPARDRP